MYTLFIILHVLVSVLLVLSILMQSSRGGGLSGTFGGTGAALFGGRGAGTFLAKVSTGLAIGFMIITIVITFLSAPRTEPTSIVKREADRKSVPSATLPLPKGALPEGELPIIPAEE